MENTINENYIRKFHIKFRFHYLNKNHFDNLPTLTKYEALYILSRRIDQLDLSSDYYKAVFHLEKYPSEETEEALLNFIKLVREEQAFVIAKRKAIEVLANIGCQRAIPIIANHLESQDSYLVELKLIHCSVNLRTSLSNAPFLS